jgi:uncharacterized membrane protein YhhN
MANTIEITNWGLPKKNRVTCVPPTWREIATFVCIFVGIAFAFVHVVVSTLSPHSWVSIASKPITPALAGFACCFAARKAQRIITAIAFFAYAVGDVFLEIEGHDWMEIVGVIAFCVGHFIITGATFIGKRSSILGENGRLGHLIVVVIVVGMIWGILSFGCDTTNLSRFGQIGYVIVLSILLVSVADITPINPTCIERMLLAGVVMLIFSDALAFAYSLCGIPDNFVVYNVIEMITYYMAIFYMAIGASFMSQWE